MSKDFVHLHVHSDFSLLDGAVTVKKLVKAAKDCDMHSLALTDHGNMFGALQFYRACKEENIKPIIGMEAYVAPGARTEQKRGEYGAYFHFLLLARDLEGYHNLMKLSSLGYKEGFYYKPRIDKEILRQYSKGLVGSSACLSSPINRIALMGSEDALRKEIEEYNGIFDPGCFFLEIQDHGLPEQQKILEKIPPLAKEYDIPMIATNDVHYLNQDDSRAQEIHLCINTGKTMDDDDRLRMDKDEFFFRNKEQMYSRFADFPDALENTIRVAEMCDVELDFSKTHLPPFHIDAKEEEQDEERYFLKLCEEGCRERYPDFDENDEVKDRLEEEIGIIKRMGFVSYFLIVWDFVRFARDNDIPVGPGRGSAAGSIVSYALGITNIDPLRYDLLFERFLNEDRISMPDIDIDFCMDGREKVIEYVREKYGEDRVSQIITFGTMAARAVIRDVGRALNVPLSEVDVIAKKIPSVPGIKLGKSLKDDKELMALKKKDGRIRELFDIAMKLEGLNRHQSTHAAGVVIGDAPLIDMVPLYRNKKGSKKGDKDEVEMVSQWSMEDLENIGMLKMDFLGLRTLTIIDRCVKEIRKTRNEEIKIDEVPLDDPATFELLCKGESTAVFQLESQGMKRILQDLQPDRFEDIIALIALYRPGPIEGGMIDNYVDRKHGKENWIPEHPILEPILKETNGVILYQEQVMRIANKMANFNLSEADTLRRAMGKKKKELMAAFTDQFVEGSVTNKVPKDLAKKIFHQIEQFAGYGFNKSHSAAYAILSYQTAYLKANYPAEFMAAVMTCEMGNTDKIVENLEECRRMGIEFRAPDINTCEKGFTVVENRIWYGLEAIKGLGGKVVDGMISAREEGPFKSIFDICERVEGNAINKSALEQLIKSGAFDCFDKKRSQLMEVVAIALKRGATARKDKEQGQLVFVFDTPAAADGDPDGEPGSEPDMSYPALEEWSESEKLSLEKESLGFYLSGHPLRKWWPVLKNYTNSTVEKHLEIPEGAEVCLGVLITKLDKRVARRTGNPFWIAAVEDMDNSTEFFINQKLYDQYGEFLHEDRIILAVGRIYNRATGKGFGVDRIIPVEKVPELMTRDVSIYIPRERDDVDKLKYNLKNVLENHNGRCPVYIVEPSGEDSTTRVEVSPSLYVTPDFELFEEIQDLFGENCLSITNTGRN